MSKRTGAWVMGTVIIILLVGMLYLRVQQIKEHEQFIVEHARDKQHDDQRKEEIRQILDLQVTAWNKCDLQGFMTGYWQSPELSFFSGKDRTSGWQATLERYQKRYQKRGKEMGRLTFADIEVVITSTESAWVRGRWQVVTSKEKLGGLFTLIIKKLPEGWRIVHDHTSAG